MTVADLDDTWWVLLITSGTIKLYAPELYASEETARLEAERWAMSLSDREGQGIQIPFENRWEIGDDSVRLVPVPRESSASLGGSWWVGTHWTKDGYPEPEATLLLGRTQARSWVLESPPGEELTSFHDGRWALSAEFGGIEGSISSADLAKCIPTQARVSRATVAYELELTATFVQLINSRILGQAGLTRSGIEELIDGAWGHLAAETGILLESSWELNSFSELPEASSIEKDS